MSELKPCPFCGGEAKVTKDRDCWGHGEFVLKVYVMCKSCHSQGKPIYDRDVWPENQMEVEAIEAWNRRADKE